jgi:hypothetical protein
MDMEPAKTIIEYLGGVRMVSSIVNKHPSRVYRWTYPVEKREGCGGIIPLRDQQRILEYSNIHGIDLVRDDFFFHERVAAILAARINSSSASSSAGDDAGVSVTPPAQVGTPAVNSHSPEVLPSGEAGAQRSVTGCAPAIVSEAAAE